MDLKKVKPRRDFLSSIMSDMREDRYFEKVAKTRLIVEI